ncbi:MAG: hypothetical protein K2X27_23965 [Candidatus Obscuribacterales bacterium]|nr:hypothetical protein [Candidatus Obscuribacterales bacterium]
MRKFLTSLAILAAVSSPAFAQEIGNDTSSGDSDAAQTVAVIPGTVTVSDTDMSIAAGGFASPGKMSFSDEQLEKIAKLKSSFQDNNSAKVAQLRSLTRELRDKMTQENLDKSAVLDLQSKINGLKSDLATARLNMRIDTLALFTPEQKQQLRHASLKRQAFGSRGRGQGHHGKKGHAGGRPAPECSEGAPKA